MIARLGINNCFAVKRWRVPDEWAQIVARELELDLVQDRHEMNPEAPATARHRQDQLDMARELNSQPQPDERPRAQRKQDA